MKTMKIEKQLLFTDVITQLVNLSVKDGLSYHKEEAGIRALGPLFIQGQYQNQDGALQNFQEVLDMDILAPTHKLNGKDFFIQVESFEGIPEEDGLHLYVTMSIHGLLNDSVQGEVTKKDIVKQEEIPLPIAIEEPILPLPVIKKEEIVQPKEKLDENIEETIVDATTFSEFEDLFEDADTTYTSYRMIVAKPDDTYASISQRYDVNEADLRMNNHDKTIEPKTLIILP